MYRLVYVIAAFYLTEVYMTDDFEKCLKLVESKQYTPCCTKGPIKKEYMDMDSKERDSTKDLEAYKECKGFSDDGDECSEKEICIAKKTGLMKNNGDIDKKAIKDMLKEKMEPVMLDNVYNGMANCIDQDLSMYGSDSCYFRALGKCLQLQYTIGCAEWSDENSCTEMKATADECAKMLSQ